MPIILNELTHSAGERVEPSTKFSKKGAGVGLAKKRRGGGGVFEGGPLCNAQCSLFIRPENMRKPMVF